MLISKHFLKESPDETLSIFWKKRIYEKLGISEKKRLKTIFLYFQQSVFLIFVKTWTPLFTFCFWLTNLWRKEWTYVLRIILNLKKNLKLLNAWLFLRLH